MSIREQLSQMAARPFRKVDIDGLEVWLRAPSPHQQNLHQTLQIDPKTLEWSSERYSLAKCVLICACVVEGEGGEPSFDQSNLQAEAEKLNNEWNARLVDSLYERCAEMLTDYDSEVKEQAKN